jgi:hypothetical protein
MTSKPTLHDVYSSIIDSLDPTDLKTVVTRMKTTSKSFKNTILGDDNMNRMLSSSYFKFNGKYLITEPIVLKKTKAEKVTFCGMTLNDIIDFISSKGYLLYFRNKGRFLYKTEIEYLDGVFLFNCTNLTNPKYNNGDWYANCTCTLEFKNSKPTIKLIETFPHLSNTETLSDIINYDRNDVRSNDAMHQAIYYQDIPNDPYLYILKEEGEEISKPKYEFTFEKFEKDSGVLITVIYKQK